MSREAEIFAEAIELADSERAAFVARTCNGDEELRARIEALLRGHAQARRVFAVPVTDRPLPSMPTEKPGDEIGRYTLVEKIGEGGCGAVWHAQQREPVRRDVALKVIKLGMDTREVVARFEAERQALALMDHPNIARVYDGGTTASGRPFFVMELVRGVPITRYCDDTKVSTRGRLTLFIEVCHAIQHAHQKGVIHRDLKPSNILVTLEDDVAVPKVIDFGIAKATQGRLTDQTVRTTFGQFIGTPAYMSPEQAEFNALDIDTRSDVYSLGVLLYELLTGHPPFDPKLLAAIGLEETRRVIREVDPPRPSTSLNTLSREERSARAQRRGTVPAQLPLLLKGDLDWIVMRCLEKNRGRRYATANGLAMDLQRHLRHEPVVARPPSRMYLAQKFVRRHRIGFGAAAAIATVLVLGAGLSTWLAIRATRAENAERQLRERAVEDRQLGLQRSSRADFKLGSRLLDEGNAGEGLAYLVRAARSDPKNLVVGPRLISALVTRNFLLPERAPLQLPAAVSWMSCTSDGSEVFVLGEDGIVRVLDGIGSRIVREFSFERRILSVSLAKNNPSIFAVHLEDGSLLVCDAATGRARTPPVRPGQISPKTGRPRLSASGRWLAKGSEGEVWIWEAATGALQAVLHLTVTDSAGRANRGQLQALDFSPDESRIVTADAGNGVRVWSLPDGTLLPGWTRNNTSAINDVQFSPDGRLTVACMSGGAQLQSATTGAKVGPLLTHDAQCTFALFTPDSCQVITTSVDRSVKVWDVGTGRPARPALHHAGPFLDTRDSWTRGPSIMSSNDGRRLLTTCADGFTRVWELETGRLLAEPALQQERPSHSVLSPDGTRVFVSTSDGLVFPLRLEHGSARPLILPRGSDFFPVGLAPAPPARLRRFTNHRMEVIDVATGREVGGGFDFPEAVTQWGNLRPDGRFLAVWTKREMKHQVWEVVDGRIRVMELQDGPNMSPWHQFSRVGDLMSMQGFLSREIRVWNLHTGRPASPPMKMNVIIFGFSPSFSPDGKRLATGALDGTVRVWEVATGRALFDLKSLPTTMVTRVAFSPDGTRLAAANANGEVRLSDGLNGLPVSPELHHRARVEQAVFSPDSRVLATASVDGSARLWDAGDGTRIGDPMVHSSIVYNVQFNAVGSQIATISGDGTCRVWDPRTGLPLTDVMRHDTTLGSLDLRQPHNGQFSPGDGRFMCTFSRSHIYLWPVPPDGGGEPAPEWLLRLATVCAGKRVTPDGVLEDASDEVAKFDEVRREMAALPADAPFAAWGRWFLADRATRSIAPGFTITPAEAERLVAALK